jgi:hypothetical protein
MKWPLILKEISAITFSAARHGTWRAKFPLYHILSFLSIGNLHKLLTNFFPEIVQAAQFPTFSAQEMNEYTIE